VSIKKNRWYFNPTIVRLKQISKTSLSYITINFNPTIVRLKPYIFLSLFPLRSRFQSYNSSIKTAKEVIGIKHTGQHFNPTIVRLKLIFSPLQFHCHSHFNPTIVRLKPSACCPMSTMENKFQSYNSSIKTSIDDGRHDCAVIISILQ